MTFIFPKWSAPKKVKALVTTRTGGVSVGSYGNSLGINGFNLAMHVGDKQSDVLANRQLLRKELPSEPIWLNQVHGTRLVDASLVSQLEDADGAFTTQKGVVCVVMTADCLPIFLTSQSGDIVALLHGGWKGLASGIIEKAIHVIKTKTNAPLLAWLGPAIGPLAYEVGEEVRQAFIKKDFILQEAFIKQSQSENKYLANLYHIATVLLKQMGVENISGGEYCTLTQKEQFYSFRREKITGRMASCIWIEE